jgi:hypothetical protein
VAGGASEAVDAAVLVFVFVMSGLRPEQVSGPVGSSVGHLYICLLEQVADGYTYKLKRYETYKK